MSNQSILPFSILFPRATHIVGNYVTALLLQEISKKESNATIYYSIRVLLFQSQQEIFVVVLN